MNRMAIFVEGQTEQEFIERLILMVAGEKNVRVEKRKVTGGSTTRRRMRLLEGVAPDRGQQYYVLIVDCGGDGAVKSRIVEEYDNLSRAGYKAVIGIRDVYPLALADITALKRGLTYRVKTVPIGVQFVLAIMEIEAWFLAEHTHLPHVDPRLTAALVAANLGFDPSCDDMQLLPQPAATMNQVYALVGKSYSKSRAAIQKTVKLLDYARVYVELPIRYPPLNELVSGLNAFLA